MGYKQKEEKKDIYLGNGWMKYFENGGSVINAIIRLSDIPDEFVYEDKNGNPCLKIQIGERKAKPDDTETSPTHWIKVDTWKPKSN